MDQGRVSEFNARVVRMEPNFSMGTVRVFLTNIEDTCTHQSFHTDCFQLQRALADNLKIGSEVQFQAKVKAISNRNYYNYVDREYVELTPKIHLTEITKIKLLMRK